MAKTRVYRDGNLIAEDFPVEQISDYLEDQGTAVWLDLCAPTDDDFAMVVDRQWRARTEGRYAITPGHPAEARLLATRVITFG